MDIENVVVNTSSLYSEVKPKTLDSEPFYTNKLRSTNYVDTYDVRIIPKKIIFLGAFQGKKFTEQILIQNVGNKKVVIRIGSPSSFAFRIQPEKSRTELSAGLSLTRSVSYTCLIQESIFKTQFPIYINNNVYTYELEVHLAKPSIVTNPVIIDFGVMNLGQSPIIKELDVQNEGDQTTTFKIDIAPSDVDILISPHRGELLAKSSLKMLLSLINAPIGYHVREFWLKCEPNPVRVTVEMIVIQKALHIVHENSSAELTIINFPMTFYGCQRHETFTLKNKSATSTTFVILLEHNQVFYNIEDCANVCPDINSFVIKPTSGMLMPFEERIFYISYRPKLNTPDSGWKNDQNNKREHSVFLRLMNVQDNRKYFDNNYAFITKQQPIDVTSHSFSVTDSTLATNSSSPSSPYLGTVASTQTTTSVKMSSEKEETDKFSMTSLDIATFDIQTQEEPKDGQINRLCLHGISETGKIIIEPNEIIIACLESKKPIKRVISLKNYSKCQEIMFSYIKYPSVFVSPTKGLLKPQAIIDVEIVITPINAGIFDIIIEFEGKALTKGFNKADEWIKLYNFSCPIKYSVSTVIYKKPQKPVFNTGLVPKNTVHAIGKNVDEIQFTNNIEKPKCAMYGIKRCPKHKDNLNDKCLIAFPNDFPESRLRTQINKKLVYRTIFSGIPRYVPTDPTTTRAMNMKKQNDSYYNQYIKKYLNLKPQAQNASNGILISSYDNISLKILNEVKTKETFEKLNYPQSCTYFPLTPIQLFNVQVLPHMVKFGKVSVDLATNEEIKINNYNSFKIKIEMKSSHPEITFPIKSTIYINPKSRDRLLVRFHSTRRGKKHKIINYIINDSHVFDLDVFADVANKHLIIKQKSFEFNRDDLDGIFQITSQPILISNPVKCVTNFHWVVPHDSGYQIIPSKGIVPPCNFIVCHLYRSLEYKIKHQTELFLVPESGLYESINVTCNVTVPKINLIKSKINVGLLPLNILKMHTAYLENPSQLEVMYLILNPNPIHGVTVEPISGILRPKSITNLYIYFQIPSIISFLFTINIEIQQTYIIYLTMKGEISYPSINIKPNKIKLRRISADSFDRLAFLLENTGCTEVAINIPIKYSEFCLSDDPDTIITPPTNQQFILMPKKSKKLFLHFYPFDVASYEFYLPFVINQLLGPVFLENENETIKPSYYLEYYQKKYTNNELCKILSERIPESLPVLRIIVTVQTHILQISKKNLNFYFTTLNSTRVVTHHDVIIKNVSRERINFLIRTDCLKNTPFMVKAFGRNIEETEIALIQNDYNASEEVKLSIWFSPLHPGIHEIKLPIYVQNYDMGNVYNYLTLYGTYPASMISTNVCKIYFGPIPLNITNQRTIFIKASCYYHSNEITAETTSKCITVLFPEGNTVCNTQDESILLPITICFKSKLPVSIFETVTLSDPFGNNCQIHISACADNSILTTHEFLVVHRECISYAKESNSIKTKKNSKVCKNKLDSAPNIKMKNCLLVIYSSVMTFDGTFDDVCIDYPQYPDPAKSQTEVNEHLDTIISVLEHLLFERFFRYEYYASIPDGILTLVTPIFGEEKRNINSNKEPPKKHCLTIFQLLTRLFGQNICKKFFTSRPIPMDDNQERVRNIYIIFKQVIDFVQAQGGCVRHIDPKFLLSFDDYLVFSNYILPGIQEDESNKSFNNLFNSILMDRNKFYLYCKRFWLDLILQIYKVAISTQITVDTFINHEKIMNTAKQSQENQDGTNISHELSYEQLNNINPIESNIYNVQERLLLTWLNKHFEYQRHLACKNSDTPLPRNIQNFDNDLSDALPLIFITISYCPYIANECFSNIYPNIMIQEMAYHNAACLINAWEKLKIGLTVTPKQIVDNNSIQMLFIISYLYFTLPFYLPSTVIHFETHLSQIVTRCIKISTPQPATYKMYFIENHNDCFHTNKDDNFIKVDSNGEILRLFYHAKKITQTTTTLLLIGDIVKGIFAENLVFTLEGKPWLTPCATIQLEAPLYENLEKAVTINVPYNCCGDFQIFRCDHQIQNIETFTAYPWKTQSLRKIPRRVFIKETILKCEGNKAKLNLYVSFLTAKNTTHSIVFINKDLGDFIVNINIIPKPIKKQLSFTFKVSKSCCPYKCVCKKRYVTDFESCPCAIRIPIGKRNKFWWECFRKSLQQTIPSHEQSFWNARLETNIGERLVQWLINDLNNPSAYQKLTIYKVKETYTVENDDLNQNILHPKTFTIEDMDIEGVVYLPVVCHVPGKYVLQLRSADSAEIRSIALTFTA